MFAETLFQPIFQSQIFEIILIIFCGLTFGSFASALTYRVPRNLPWVKKGKSEHGLRSACPSCKNLLTPRDLIPLCSWLMANGKCRHCDVPISKQYPLCELVTLLGCIGIYAVYGLTWFAIPFLLMIPFLVALMMIDFEHLLLPNQLVAIIFGFGMSVLCLRIISTQNFELQHTLITYMGGALLFSTFSWLLGFVMTKILKKEALGFGDVKFFAASGIWLGIPALGYFCIGAGAIGVALSIAWKKATGSEVFPFGPALILSFYSLLLLQGSHLL